MNWKKLLCAGLSGALLTGAMAGCGAAEPQPTPAADDIAYQATGLSRDTVLFTVDGREVTADQYLYWLLTSISTAKSAGYLADDEAWEEEIEGQPTAGYLKEQALEISKLYASVANHADEAGIVVTEDQRAEAEVILSVMSSRPISLKVLISNRHFNFLSSESPSFIIDLILYRPDLFQKQFQSSFSYFCILQFTLPNDDDMPSRFPK